MEFLNFILSHLDEIKVQTLEHLKMTIVSMVIASTIGVSIGILITRVEKVANFFLGIIGIIQTIPSLALLGFLLPFFGIGTLPAIIALFLYGLLPIVRNTYTGIKEIDPSIIEASRGMGMTEIQLLRFVKLPIAFPVILAGIRTATVINVGIATLCALIAAGGLGEFIFRGISLNNQHMILAGAIPASILAISLDSFIGYVQKNIRNSKRLIIASVAGLAFFILLTLPSEKRDSLLVAGFNSEFIERQDGFIGLDSLYNLPFEIKEMEVALMYKALYQEDVDVIDGFSTDGRIKEYNLKSLVDDKHYFPPYDAVPILRKELASKHPELIKVFNILDNAINDQKMAELNYLADGKQIPPAEVANSFLKELKIYANKNAGKAKKADLVIGSKAFTESYILAHLFAQLIENKTSLTTRLELGVGGTMLLFDALRTGGIDIYPEYTGTAYLVLLNEDPKNSEDFTNKDVIYNEISKKLLARHDVLTMPTIGFKNTFALMMRAQHADSLNIHTISDLSAYLNDH